MKLLSNARFTLTERDSEVDITPMLDVVFILLIFFIVTASFTKEFGLDLNKPTASINDDTTVLPIVVSIDENNQFSIMSRVIADSALKSTVVRLRAEQPQAAVVIRVHPKSTTRAMIGAIDKLRSANVEMPPISLMRT